VLVSLGVALACFLILRLARESVEGQVAQDTNYLLIASTPVFELPAATPIPTRTVTPVPTVPTPTPVPLPAIRLSIPVIELNINIQEVSPTQKRSSRGETGWVWDPPAFAAGHYTTSGVPLGGRNIVLIGHNNTQGEVFRHLDLLDPGHEVILYTERGEFHYQVQKKFMIPYLGVEKEGDAKLQSYAAPQDREMITLISCWPYATNSHRIVIIAVPEQKAGLDAN
jgi:LPXTG-site transpeptidase (sortase) family protein